MPLAGFTQETKVQLDFAPSPEKPDVDPDHISWTYLPLSILEDDIMLPGLDIEASGLGWLTDMRPATFPTFAEYIEPNKKITDERVDDTGPVWRAFIPIDSETTRRTVSDYSGPMKVFDARTVCVRPTIEKFAMRRTGVFESDAPARQGGTDLRDFPLWQGVVQVDPGLIPDLYDVDRTGLRMSFSCPIGSPGSGRNWTLPGYENYFIDLDAPLIPMWMKCSAVAGLGPWDKNDAAAEDQQLPQRMSSLDPLFYNESGILAENDEYLRRKGRIYPELEDVNISDDDIKLNEPREFFWDARAGNSFIIMSTGTPEKWAFPGAADTYNLTGREVSIQSAKGNGSWLDFSAFFAANETLDLPDDRIEFRKDLTIPLRITFCLDVMMYG
jgi:hypothetical protein